MKEQTRQMDMYVKNLINYTMSRGTCTKENYTEEQKNNQLVTAYSFQKISKGNKTRACGQRF